MVESVISFCYFVELYIVYMETTLAVQWDIYMNVQCGRQIYSDVYANNVKCMYTSIPSHILDSSEFL